MCTAQVQGFLAKAGKLDLGGRLSQYTDTKDPIMKGLGYSGIWNPAEEVKHQTFGTKSPVHQKSVRQGIAARDKAHMASSVQGQPGHVMAIAARKARNEM